MIGVVLCGALGVGVALVPTIVHIVIIAVLSALLSLTVASLRRVLLS